MEPAGSWTPGSSGSTPARSAASTSRCRRTSPRPGAEGGGAPAIPPNAFFISARYGERPHYVLTGSAPDAAVQVFDYDDGSIAKAHDSVWDWITAFVQDTQFFMALGIARGNARRGERGAGP